MKDLLNVPRSMTVVEPPVLATEGDCQLGHHAKGTENIERVAVELGRRSASDADFGGDWVFLQADGDPGRDAFARPQGATALDAKLHA